MEALAANPTPPQRLFQPIVEGIPEHGLPIPLLADLPD
jgi:hypothetical protein